MAGLLSACQPTYPAQTLLASLTKLNREENNIPVTPRIAGETLWIYAPIEGLIDEKTLAWNKEALEKLNKVMNTVHRVLLSTDAKITFAGIIAADIKKFGIEFIIIEYVPDLREAVLEKFSRGEFFLRSVREVNVNPSLIGDKTGENLQYQNITFDEFLSLQIIHRAKSLFAKDKKLSNLFEVKSSSWSVKFGVLKIDMEFLKKRYDLTQEEEKIDPLDTLEMIAASVLKTYDYKDVQAVELTDTFTQKSVKRSREELKKVRIKLPEFTD